MDYLLDLFRVSESPRRSGSDPSCLRSSSERSPPATSVSTRWDGLLFPGEDAVPACDRGRGGRVQHRRPPPRGRYAHPRAGDAILLACSLVLGALLACASIADGSETWWPGIPIGVGGRLARLHPRPGPCSAASAPAWTPRRPRRSRCTPRGSALLGAGLSVLFPPLAILFVAALAWLLIGGRSAFSGSAIWRAPRT